MSRRLRIVTATALLAIVTPYVAGVLALGYGFSEKARSGVLYHWLYAVPEVLAQYAAPDQAIVWFIASAVVYAVQYLLFFVLLAYAMFLFSRVIRIVVPNSSEASARLIAWVFAGVILMFVLWLGNTPLLLAALAAGVFTWVSSPSLNERADRGQYAADGT